MKKLLLLAGILLSVLCKAQNFVPDGKGYIADPAFQKLVKARGYQLVTAFDTSSLKPLKITAKALKNGQFITINTKGEELPTAAPLVPVRVSPGGGLAILQ